MALKKSPTKSVQTAGKSSYSHGSGHQAVKGYLAGKKDTLKKLHTQVGEVESGQRRNQHRDRLEVMGPIRLHNLFRNLMKKKVGDLDKSEKELATLFQTAFYDYVTDGVTDKENPFHDVFPSVSSVSFGHALEDVLNSSVANTYDKLSKDTQVPIFKDLPAPKERKPKDEEMGEFEERDEEILPEVKEKKETVQDLVKEGLKAGKTIDESGIPKEAPEGWKSLEKEGEKWETPKEGQQQTKELPKKSLAVKRKPNLGATWMNDRELGFLLHEEEAEDVHVTAAVNVLRHPAALATLIRDDFMLIVRNGRGIPRFTIVPINLGNRHWTMLVIEQNPDRRSAPRCYYFNSMGAEASEVNLIQAIVRASRIYTNSTIHNLTEDALQHDAVTCGSWALEAAQVIVNQRRENDQALDQQGILALGQQITLGENARETHRQNMQHARDNL